MYNTSNATGLNVTLETRADYLAAYDAIEKAGYTVHFSITEFRTLFLEEGNNVDGLELEIEKVLLDAGLTRFTFEEIDNSL